MKRFYPPPKAAIFNDPGSSKVDPNNSSTVIAPSLPGYTFSSAPEQRRFGIDEIADVFAELRSDVLGYSRFGAQGGDWGSFVASRLGYAYPARGICVRLNLLPVRRDAKMLENPTVQERQFSEELNYLL
jgi:pimeloyl-ACP methyl ester carboxylesterase